MKRWIWGVSRKHLVPTTLSFIMCRWSFDASVVHKCVTILGSLPLIFPHSFDHFSFYYASPFASSAFPYFSEHSPWFLLDISLMTPLLPHFHMVPFPFTFLGLPALASTCQLITYYLRRPPSPFKVVPLISWPTRGCQHPYDLFIP